MYSGRQIYKYKFESITFFKTKLKNFVRIILKYLKKKQDKTIFFFKHLKIFL